MNASRGRTRALVLTLGPWHDRPWWWAQLADSPWLEHMGYERFSFGARKANQIGFAQLPSLAWRTWRLLRRARRQGVQYVFTFEGDATCYLIGLMQRLPWLRSPRQVIVQFISGESSASAGSRLKDFVARNCLRSVHRLIVSSKSEGAYYVRRFGWPADKVSFVPLNADDRLLAQPIPAREDFIVAAGRSYRDYKTLAAAVAGTGIRTIIVCGRSGPGVRELPPEVELRSELPLDELLNLMARARANVLPLEDRRISTGQTVLLQAMALGQPVVVTRTAGTEDYIRDGVDGLLVPPADVQALRAAIRRIYDDTALASRLGAEARSAVASRHRPAIYVDNIARALGCPPPRADKLPS
jgi:glycosyltransferase involved in cell wall biosynthesis